MAWGTSPFVARSSVLLPEPDGPTIASDSPGATDKSKSDNIRKGAAPVAGENSLDTPESCKSISAMRQA